MVEIKLNEIKSYKVKRANDYSKGGFYLIIDIETNKKYIGKSIDYLSRLKQHLYKSSNKTLIDLELKKDISKFRFYLLHKYSEFNINFFNRKLETIIEQKLIKENQTYSPKGFNNTYYEYIRIK